MIINKINLIVLLLILASFTAIAANETCSFEAPEECENESIINEATLEHSDLRDDQVCIAYFYGRECSKCAQLKPYLEELKQEYGDKIHFKEYEVYHDLENYNIYNSYCSIQGIELTDRGVPFIAVGDKYFMGLNTIKDNLKNEIDRLIETEEYICPLGSLGECHLIEQDLNGTNPAIPIKQNKITLPLIAGTGLIDGINPCAFAVLIFLITFLLEISNSKRKMIQAGIAYIAAVYVSYLLAGIGLLGAIQISGLSGIIVKVAAIIAILAGIVNIKDYFAYGKWISLSIPKRFSGTIENWTRKANIPAAIVLGFLVSMFELPCTGGVYLAILALLANTATWAAAFGYLLLYNLMFVLPLIVILVLVIKGAKAEHIENWRKTKRNIMKLIMGILLLVLGALMLTGVI